jgi:hypothetical protein
MSKLEADAAAMPAGRKAATFDHRRLVRHVGMRRIMCDRIDAGLRHDLARLEFLCHSYPPNLSTISETEFNRTVFRAGPSRFKTPAFSHPVFPFSRLPCMPAHLGENQLAGWPAGLARSPTPERHGCD